VFADKSDESGSEREGEMETEFSVPSSSTQSLLPQTSSPLCKQNKLKTGEIKQKLPYFSVNRKGYWHSLAVAVCLFSLLSGEPVNADTVAVIARREECGEKNGQTSCTITQSAELTLSPQGTANLILLQGPNSSPFGTLSLTVESIGLACQVKSEYFARSFEMRTASIRRCALSGSCKGEKCQVIDHNTLVPELDGESNRYPGETRCMEVCGCWLCGCLSCGSACLLWRNYALPSSDTVFEVFTCPAWQFRVQIRAELKLSNSTQVHRFKLTPGVKAEWKQMEVLLKTVSPPPLPVLGSQFLTNGKETVMVRASASGQPVAGVVGALQCGSRAKAEKMECFLASQMCDCVPQDDIVGCLCRDGVLEALYERKDLVVPLVTQTVTISGAGTNLMAEYSDFTTFQMQFTANNLQIFSQVDNSKCAFSVITFAGCFKCLTGAALAYRCQTDRGRTMGHVTCREQQFAVQCDPTGELRETQVNFKRAQVDEQCLLRCPGGSTDFKLQASLVYVEKKLLFNHSNIVTGKEIDSDFSWLDLADLLPNLSLANIIMAVVGFVGLILLLLVTIPLLPICLPICVQYCICACKFTRKIKMTPKRGYRKLR